MTTLARCVSFAILLLWLPGCASVLPSPLPEANTALPLKGQLSAVKVRPGHAIRITATWGKQAIPITARGWGQVITLSSVSGQRSAYEGFIAIPLHAKAGYGAVIIASEEPEPQIVCLEVEVLPRASFRTIHLKIKGYSRYDYGSESHTLASARKQPGAFLGSRISHFFQPIENGRITGEFGSRRSYNHGAGVSYHLGIDIAAPSGTPILSPADGKVILTRSFEAHGNTVLIDHGFGVVTTYLHQSQILVTEGQCVKQGQPIGAVGSTGGSTGAHLHFQVNVNNLPVDPEDFLTNGKGPIFSDKAALK